MNDYDQFDEPGCRFVRVFLPREPTSTVEEVLAHGCDKAVLLATGHSRRTNQHRLRLSRPGLVQLGVCLALDDWDDRNHHSYTRLDIYKSYLRHLLSATMDWLYGHRAVAVGNLGIWSYSVHDLEAVTDGTLGDVNKIKGRVTGWLAKRSRDLSLDRCSETAAPVFETRPVLEDERSTVVEMVDHVFLQFSSWDLLRPSLLIERDATLHPIKCDKDLGSLFTSGVKQDDSQAARLHALICITDCGPFRRLVRAFNDSVHMTNRLPDPDDKMVVPVILDKYPPSSGWPKPSQPPPDDDHSGGPERLTAFLRTQTDRRKHYRGVLRIVVDARHVHTWDPFDPIQPLIYEFSVDNYSRFLEIVGKDREGELLLAIIPISDIDPLEDNPSDDFTITRESGQTFHIGITPSRDPSGRLRVRLGYQEKRLPRAAALYIKREYTVVTRAVHNVLVRVGRMVYTCVSILRRYVVWFLAPIARIPYPREAVIVILLLALAAQAYLDNYRRESMERHVAVLETIVDDYRESAQLLVSLAKGYVVRVEEDVSRIEVVGAVARGQTFPYPTFGDVDPLVTRALAEELERFPVFRAEYEDYLRQWADVFRALGTTLAEIGKLPEAIRVFEYLVEITQKPNNDVEREKLLGLLFGLGELYKMKGDHHAAVHVYDEIVERGLASNDPRPRHYAGWSWYILRDYEKALAYYDEALLIDPRYAKVFYNKALIFRDTKQAIEYRKHLDKAIELTEEVYQREGDANPRIPFSLAIFYTEKGELENALAMLEQACAIEPFYVVRAEEERAFGLFRDPESGAYHSRYQTLLDRYRARQHALGSPSSTYDPTVYNE